MARDKKIRIVWCFFMEVQRGKQVYRYLPVYLFTFSLHQLFNSGFANRIIFGLCVMDDDRSGGLLGDQLTGGGEAHAEFGLCGGQQLEDLEVILQFRDGWITPGITLALLFTYAQFTADVFMKIVGSCLRG